MNYKKHPMQIALGVFVHTIKIKFGIIIYNNMQIDKNNIHINNPE